MKVAEVTDDRPTCDGLGAPQVLARIPGLTYRKLDYWSRTGRLTPHRAHDRDSGDDAGSGVPYCWPLDQVAIAGRMHQLTQLGFNLATATELAHNPGRLATVQAALEGLAYGRKRAP